MIIIKSFIIKLDIFFTFELKFISYKTLNTDRIILGIDPGTNIMGYGLIQQKNNKITLIKMDVLNLQKVSNQPLKLKKYLNPFFY